MAQLFTCSSKFHVSLWELGSSVVDPFHFNADPDRSVMMEPDPDSETDPVPDPR